ncbi:polysaccharide biosynthesis/export family protein [Mucilaginibacter koreensis]
MISTLFSCSSAKRVKYFKDIPDSGALSSITNAEYIEPKIQVDDIITIIVQTVDPKATEAINLGNVASASTSTTIGVNNYNQQISAGYLVDKAGDIEMPIIGKIKVAGYTTREATDVIRTAVSKDLKNPTVIVRYANFRVNVTGEVARPGAYIMPNEKVSILDAIAVAGDLTIYGKRENVLVLRQNPDGTKMPYRLNLQNSKVMSSPAFYLHQNDVVYVEPTKAKAAANDVTQARTYTIIGSLLSVLIVLFSRIN